MRPGPSPARLRRAARAGLRPGRAGRPGAGPDGQPAAGLGPARPAARARGGRPVLDAPGPRPGRAARAVRAGRTAPVTVRLAERGRAAAAVPGAGAAEP